MTVYQLIKELTKYNPNDEVYFTADGTVKEYEWWKWAQLGYTPEKTACYAVEGVTNGVKDYHGRPNIQCEITI